MIEVTIVVDYVICHAGCDGTTAGCFLGQNFTAINPHGELKQSFFSDREEFLGVPDAGVNVVILIDQPGEAGFVTVIERFDQFKPERPVVVPVVVAFLDGVVADQVPEHRVNGMFCRGEGTGCEGEPLLLLEYFTNGVLAVPAVAHNH